MRAIDGDHLKRWIISRGLKSQLHPADIIDQIDRESTIEPRCETCEAFNKTRLLIPQPQRKTDMREDAEEPKKCDTCLHEKEPWSMQCHRCEDYNLWEGKR